MKTNFEISLGTMLCFLLSVLAFNNSYVFAQWTRTNGPYGGQVNCLVKNGNDLLAGSVAGVFYSSNEGEVWSHVLEVDTTFDLELHGSTIIAGTTAGIVLSNNGGMTWTPSNSGLPNGVVLSVESHNGNLWAGTRQSVFKSNDNGMTWLPSAIGLPSTHVNSILGVGTNVFLGTDLGVYRSANNGTTWSLINNGLTGGLPKIENLATNGTEIYATSANSPEIFKTNDNGNLWIPIAVGLQQGFVYSVGVDGNHIYIGTSAPSGNCIYHSTNNGSSWTSVPIYDNHVNDFCFSGGYIYTGGEYGIFKGANVSGNWENLGLGHANLVKCLASNGNDLIAGTGFGFYLSADNGTTWHRSTSGIPISSLVPQAVIEDVIVDNGNIYGCSWGDGIYKSTDGGISWIQANAGLPINVILGIDTVVYLSSLSSLNSILYAGTGDDGVYKSLDSGASWIAANNGLPTPCGVINLAVSNPVVYATIWGEGIYLTTNAANNWTLTSSVGAGGLKTDGPNVYAGGGYLYYSTNFGSAWSSNLVHPEVITIEDIEVHNAEIFVAGQAGLYQGLEKTSDLGQNWVGLPQGVPDCSHFNTLLSHNGNLFAGKETCAYQPNGVFRYGGPLSAPQFDEESNFVGYPNPTTRIFTIRNAESKIKTIRVFNGLGVEVVPPIQNNEVDFTNQPLGIYIIDLQTTKGKNCLLKVIKQ